MIRHKETDKVSIEHDPHLVEALFYNYYNLIRLVLLHLDDKGDEQ